MIEPGRQRELRLCPGGARRRELVAGTPAYYLVSATSVWLSSLHDGVFFLIQTSRPASLLVGDFGPSATRAWLFGVMASVYGS